MQTLDSLPVKLREYIGSQLAPGELVVWAGQPDIVKAVAANRGVIIWTKICAGLTIAMGVFFLLVAPSIVTLILLLTFLSAAYLMWRTTFGEKERYLDCASIVTNQRAMSATVWKKPKAVVFGPDKLTQLEINEETDGCGSIVFYRVEYTAGAGDAKTRKSYPVGFFNIPCVREAERHLRALSPGKAA